MEVKIEPDRTIAATARRLGLLVAQVAQDSIRARAPVTEDPGGVADSALTDAINWLVRAHDATGRRGSSRGYSLLTGWAPAFPETTGYIIGTLVAYAQTRERGDLMARARELADWELEVQGADGGIMQGLINVTPRRSIAFNTGMVIHGWLDLAAATGESRYLEAASRGGRFLVERQSPDGTWRGESSYRGIPHTYKARVAWALLRLGEATGAPDVRRAATRNLDWVLSTQRPNGWFEHCEFKPGTLPNTHGIAYTLRGLVESYALVGDERYLSAAKLTSRVLIDQLAARGTLPAVWNADWTSEARYRCLTGIVQLGGTWLRIHELTGEEEFKLGGLRAVEHAASYQLRSTAPDLRGALPGSFPIYGAYAPLACPNWATKFLADGLMLSARATSTGQICPDRSAWG
jgi:uncharacterized protein YyaL (SSP411 family)